MPSPCDHIYEIGNINGLFSANKFYKMKMPNTTFNNISVIPCQSWKKSDYMEKSTKQPSKTTNKLYHIKLYWIPGHVH